MNTRKNPGRILPEAARERLSALVTEMGEVAAANRLGVAKTVLARAVAGFPLRRASETAITLGIALLGKEAA